MVKNVSLLNEYHRLLCAIWHSDDRSSWTCSSESGSIPKGEESDGISRSVKAELREAGEGDTKLIGQISHLRIA